MKLNKKLKKNNENKIKLMKKNENKIKITEEKYENKI